MSYLCSQMYYNQYTKYGNNNNQKTLKRNAERENRTLNNYVESVLLGIVFDEPNEVTKAAIQEAKSGKNPNKVYDNVDELFKDLDSDK